jgi:hypothetical protein
MSRPELRCRFCRSPLHTSFVDLGMSPLCQTHITPAQLAGDGAFLSAACLRLRAVLPGAAAGVRGARCIFSEYAYFSSYSSSWVEHCAALCGADGPALRPGCRAAGDGSGQQRRLPAAALRGPGVPVLGIEPAANVARKWRSSAACPPRCSSWAAPPAAPSPRARPGRPGGWATTCWPMCPTSTTSCRACASCWRRAGVITMEFPHLQRLIEGNQFDTIYHEHFSYLSFSTVEQIFAAHGLVLFDVEELPTHGGSIRIYARHASATFGAGRRARGWRAARARARAGLPQLERYLGFGEQVRETKRRLLSFLIEAKRRASGRRLRRAGQGQHAAQLLRHPHRLPRLHRRRQPLQAGQVHAGHAHPDPRPPRRSAKPGPTTC